MFLLIKNQQYLYYLFINPLKVSLEQQKGLTKNYQKLGNP